jgi:hypothetical protein
MRVPCSPETYYRLTLAEQGFLPPAEDEQIAKIAEARSCSVEVVKLAQVYFEQLQKDGVPYEDPVIMTSDAFKMAEAYLEHKNACEMEAAAFVDGLATKLAEVAKTMAEEAGIGEMSPLALLKIAGLQAQETLDLATAIAMAPTLPEPAKTAEGAAPAFDPKAYHSPYGTLNAPTLLKDVIGHMHGLSGDQLNNPDVVGGHVRQMTSGLHSSVTPDQIAEHIAHHLQSNNLALNQANAVAATKAARDRLSGVQGLVRRNKGALIGGGVMAGVGAVALLNHLHDKSKAENEIKNLEALVRQKQTQQQESPNVQRP